MLNYQKIFRGKAFGLSRATLSTKLSPFVAILAITISFFGNGYAQQRCAILEYQESLNSKGLVLEPIDQFENWLIEKRREKLMNQPLGVEKLTQIIYTIPVVVHIIHNGEPVGSGSNISDQQIISQIEVLNEDFRRNNLDAILTPAEFLPVAADPEIEFVLAKQDPDGFPTTGITRSLGSETSYSPSTQDHLIKQLAYWPAEDYFNIWVAPLSGGFLGYASFPETNLPGIDEPELNAMNDGVIVAYDAFGSADKYPAGNYRSDFDKGRTTSHEVGHFLGLRHISGDGGCSVDDFCLDTPEQDSQTNGCPNGRNTCGTEDMFQNYMDYTDDRCMNLFTECQKGRMRTVLENSPRRLSLLTSHGLEDPVSISNDLAISEITSPEIGECDISITPSLVIRNVGTDLVTGAVIKVSANGSELETKTFSLNLAVDNSTEIFFSPLTAPSQGNNTFDFEVQSVNGASDTNTANNSMSVNTFISFDEPLPFIESFESFQENWNVVNGDESVTWEVGNAIYLNTTNQAIKVSFYEYPGGVGQKDYLITPLIDLTGGNSPALVFDRAYAPYPNSSADNLTIAVSLDCGNSFPFVIFNKSGPDLQTSSPTVLPFTPTSATDWKKEFIDLSAFAGLADLQIAFIATNGFGNNLYLDNIKVTKSPIIDLTISEVVSPNAISCEPNAAPIILVTNSGTTTINDITTSITSNGVVLGTKSFTGLNLTPGNQRTLIMDAITLESRNNILDFNVESGQGDNDFNPQDNLLSSNYVVITESEYIPLRQEFNDLDNIGNWTITESLTSNGWAIEPAINKEQNNFAASIKVWNKSEAGTTSSLISPILDFSLVREASVQFRISYASVVGKNDILRVKASTDCGNNFQTLYEKSSQDLEVRQTQTEWIPQSESDWIDEYLGLTSFAGEKEVLLVFEFTNGGGNNLFLDDIEFYLSNDPDPIEIEEDWNAYPNPSLDGIFNITLNLDAKSETVFTIISAKGEEIYKTVMVNSLNQTLPIDLSTHPPGIYFMRVKNDEFDETRRVIIKP